MTKEIELIIKRKVEPLIYLGYELDVIYSSSYEIITLKKASKIIQLDFTRKEARLHDWCFGEVSALSLDEIKALELILGGEEDE